MAMIPGAYARVAGVQSEINKVTITRVAGNEVQFRRAIDSYQKDLRYNVNQIGREQKQLKKSMGRYYKKLRQGKRERKKREAKEKEDSDRQRLNARQFKEAERAVRRRDVLLVNHPDHPPAATLMIQGEDAEVVAGVAAADDGPRDSAEHHLSGIPSVSTTTTTTTTTLPESPDSGIGTDPDERSSAASTAGSVKEGANPVAGESGGGGGGGVRRKVFLTSNKIKLPYLKASRGGGNKDRTQGGERSQNQGEELCPDEDGGGASAQTNAEDVLLPVISEEAEDKEGECNVHSKARPSDQGHLQASPRDGKAKDHLTLSSTTVRLPKAGPVASLNTKTAPASMDTLATSNVTGNDDASGLLSQSGDVSMPTPVRRVRHKTGGVSFGDLMKLQHTHSSGTKRLFSLVDKLASKHGIVDAPLPSSNSPSIDPRSNVKIKQRGEKQASSQMSGGMKHASDVLYSMKYGYRDSDGAFSDDVASPVYYVLSDGAAGALNNQEDASLDDNNADNPKKSQASVPAAAFVPDTDIVDAATRKVSLTTSSRRDSDDVASAHYPDTIPHKPSVASSGRRASIDVTSPYYTFGDVASPIFEGIAPDGGVTHQHLDVGSERHGSRARQPLSMAQLSEHATRARDRNHLRATSPGSPGGDDSPSRSQLVPPVSGSSRPAQRLSPLLRGGRPSDRQRRRDSVNNQLQMRLSVAKDEGNMAWQSAFGRLKVLHTLFDLSPHFDKEP